MNKILEILRKMPFKTQAAWRLAQQLAKQNKGAMEILAKLSGMAGAQEILKNHWGKVIVVGGIIAAGAGYKAYYDAGKSLPASRFSKNPDDDTSTERITWAVKHLSARFNEEDMLALLIYMNYSIYGHPGSFNLMCHKPITANMVLLARQDAFESWKRECDADSSYSEFMKLMASPDGHEPTKAVIDNKPPDKKGKQNPPIKPNSTDNFDFTTYDLDEDIITISSTDEDPSVIGDESEDVIEEHDPSPVVPGAEEQSGDDSIIAYEVQRESYPAALVDAGLVVTNGQLVDIDKLASYTYALMSDNHEYFGSDFRKAWGIKVPPGTKLVVRKRALPPTPFKFAPRPYNDSWFKAFTDAIEQYITGKRTIIALADLPSYTGKV